MHIGVTGGAGYIGSHVVRDLLEAGHTVTVLDNMSNGNPQNILRQIAGYSFIEGSTLCQEDLNALMASKPEIVFHFGDLKSASLSMLYPEEYSRNNLEGALKLLTAMMKQGCRYFVYSSSAAVYGTPRYLPIDEKHPLQPINYYGFTKMIIEENLRWFSQLKGIYFASLRYFNAAGYDIRGRIHGLEKQASNLLPVIMDIAVGKRKKLEVFGDDYDTTDGTCIRDYIHVTDLSRAHLMAMEFIMKEKNSLTVNLGNQKGHSVMEMLAAARRITGEKIEHVKAVRRKGDPAILVANSQKAEKLLGWKAQHSDLNTLVETSWNVYNRQLMQEER